MDDPSNNIEALASDSTMKSLLSTMTTKRKRNCQHERLPPPSLARLAESLHERTHDLHEYLDQAEQKRGTVLYLAYGSNLSNETFRGKRGIKPLSQVNVQVPELRVTFDLPGIAYVEPCFANTGRRDPDNDPPSKTTAEVGDNEKSPLIGRREYRKDKWHKGLIGVVYEVTAEDYAHIIQTEGGGASYQDILVDCHPFVSSDPTVPVPQDPTLPAFKAHTLFAPAASSDEDPPSLEGPFHRPDTSYAQPSARYLKLMTDGAAEVGLPYEYQDYLHSIRPYTITTVQQRMGQFVFLALWIPIVGFIFGLGKMFADNKGRLPAWLRRLTGAIFRAAWDSYDQMFNPVFGDGERTISDGGGETDEAAMSSKQSVKRRIAGEATKSELEKTVVVNEIV